MNSHTKDVLLATRDPHNRVKQLLKDIERIEKNNFEPLKKDKRKQKRNIALPPKLLKENQKLLLEFNEMLEKDYHKGKLSVSGWQKSISEAAAFARFFNKPVTKLERKDIEQWFKRQEERLMNNEIGAWSIRKYASQGRKFIRFAFKLPQKKYIDWFDWISEELPAKPKRQFNASDLPSQADIKRVIESVYVDGKRMSIRNQAILALCNDIGCRISEALEIRNKDIMPEQNFLVITLPKSKTEARTVVSFLAKPFLEQWSRISPNKDKGEKSGVPFFCNSLGQKVRYPVVRKALLRALNKTGVVFPKNKNTHFFRALFASRSFAWGRVLRNFWLGWSSGISDSYTAMDYKACIKPYFEMLKEENNPMMQGEAPFWQKEGVEDKVLAKLTGKPEFKMLMDQTVREIYSP